MNFFGHYFTDSKEGNYWYNVGLVFPDLFRDLYKSNKPDRSLQYASQKSKDFLAGTYKHVLRDKDFHSTSYFVNAELELKKYFKLYGIYEIAPRSWFMIHVLLELVTDKFLVINHHQKANNLYIDIAKVLEDIEITNELFTEKESKSIFLYRLDLIHQDKFIFAYSNNEKLIDTLWRVYSRVGIKITMEEKDFLTLKLLKIIERLNENDLFNWTHYKAINL